MMNAIGIALQGLGFANRQVEQSAAKIANPQEGADLTEEIVNMKVAETSYKANLAVVKTTDEMSDELLHIFDEHV
jgi:flagellar hook protein FlgE